MEALALFTAETGWLQQLFQPVGKGAQAILKGTVPLERILTLPNVREQPPVVELQILSRQVSHGESELPGPIMTIGVTRSTDRAGKTPLQFGRVNNVADLLRPHMVPARAVTHLATHSFFHPGIAIRIVPGQVTPGTVLPPKLFSPERTGPFIIIQRPHTPCDPQFSASFSTKVKLNIIMQIFSG